MAAAKSTAVKIKVIHTGKFPLPEYSTKGSAAMDLVAEIGRQQHIIQGSNQLIPTGQVYVSLCNSSEVTQYIEPGERIAQLVIEKVIPFQWEQVDELEETDRGVGGFGSTGETTKT